MKHNRSKSKVRRLLHALYWIEHAEEEAANRVWNLTHRRGRNGKYWTANQPTP